MNDIDVRLILGSKPEQIIEYLKRKGFKISWNWQDVWKEAHTKAFTVAKAMKLDILTELRNELEKALEEGLTFEQFKKNIEPSLKAKGWWGKVKAKDVPSDIELPANIDPEKEVLLGSPWRLKTIYRTNLDVAYSAGHYKAMIDNIEDHPYWLYNAVLDSKTRPSHRALHGKVFRADDPIWDKIYPPNGWNCRCTVIPLDDDDLKELNLDKPSRLSGKEQESLLKNFKIDKGWDYNPGKSALEFDSDFGTFEIYKKQPTFSNYKRPKFNKIDDSMFEEIKELFPTVSDIGEKKFWTLVNDYFQFQNKNYINIKTYNNENALLSTNTIKYLISKKDGRERFLPLLDKTLQSPYEVYLSLYKSSDKGFVEYRKHYIGLFKDKKKRNYYIIVKEKKDSFIVWNAFPAKNIDDYRKGTLLYAKGT